MRKEPGVGREGALDNLPGCPFTHHMVIPALHADNPGHIPALTERNTSLAALGSASLIPVSADNPTDLYERLNAAVESAREDAIKQRHGILVTQLGFGSFTVAVSPDVPFGLTAEKLDWRPPAP
jgi:hypothetical protein